jgi:hypothetical protein
MHKDNYRRMNLDRQIELYEDCINRLEDCWRAGSGDSSKIKNELDKAYQQVTLLKIRRMMLAS